jgi:hypothetical protein
MSSMEEQKLARDRWIGSLDADAKDAFAKIEATVADIRTLLGPAVTLSDAMFDQIDTWLSLTSQPAPSIESGSALAGDARKCPTIQGVHAAWNGVVQAVDHLHALKVLVDDAQVLHTFAPYTLLRSAIENAATAVWLLSPRKRSERLQRCFRLAHHEAWEYGKVTKLLPPEHHSKRSAEERIEEIRSLASSLDLDLSYVLGQFSYEKVVKDAGETASLGVGLSPLLWRLGAGFSHGRYWASLSMLERQEVTREADILNVRLTSSLDAVMMTAQGPFQLISKAMELLDQRRQGRLPV